MTNKIVKIGDIDVANNKPFVLFGGMNVLESRDMAMQVQLVRHDLEPFVDSLAECAIILVPDP